MGLRINRWSRHGISLLGSNTPESIYGNRPLRSRQVSAKRFSADLKLPEVEIT